MTIADLLKETRSTLEGYWSHASEDLETHTPETLAQIQAVLDDFAAATENLGADPKDAFDRMVAKAFQRFHMLNDTHDGGLLETDEREMIVPFFDQVAVALGIDLALYEDQDVTFAVREF